MLLPLSLILTGCELSSPVFTSISADSAPVELPPLSAAEQVRDDLARAEWAISARAQQMAAASTQCPQCYTALDKLFEDAMARLDLAGGMWNPWGDFALREDAAQYVEIPTDPIDAPFTVAALTAFMLTSATQQLDELAVPAEVEGDERQAMGALLAGRVVSAQLLASAFDFDLQAAVKKLPQDATSGGAAGSSTATAQGDEARGDTDEEAHADLALAHLDCARTGVLGNRNEVFSTETALKISDDLNERMNRLVEEGAKSSGRVRCEVNASSLSEAFTHLLQADLLLLSSPAVDQRLAGAGAVSQDALRWARYEPATAPAVSLLVEDDDADEQQS